uniref:Uncharacterized protein n=1 Tax=Marseillevirus LCMAC103 TaxID=2506604 RepID=A0A481YV11_9VIRU|nr:MAG: hypothetical protein LCMAC103_02180 [Marseillevirus LCMAC103]
MSYLSWAANNRVTLVSAAVAAFAGYTVPYIFPEWKAVWRVNWWPLGDKFAADFEVVKSMLAQLVEEKKDKPAPRRSDRCSLLTGGFVPHNQPWVAQLARVSKLPEGAVAVTYYPDFSLKDETDADPAPSRHARFREATVAEIAQQLKTERAAT